MSTITEWLKYKNDQRSLHAMFHVNAALMWNFKDDNMWNNCQLYFLIPRAIIGPMMALAYMYINLGCISKYFFLCSSGEGRGKGGGGVNMKLSTPAK